MVRKRIHGEDTEFNAWLRSQRELPSSGETFGFVACDNDLTIHRYITAEDSIGTRQVQGIMQIEVKSRLAMPHPSQLDTLTKLNGFRGTIKIGSTYIRNFGVFFLILQGTTPDNSEYMLWGESDPNRYFKNAKLLKWKTINHETLMKILRFDLHPSNLTTNPFRRHHKTRHVMEIEKTELGFEVEKIVKKSS